MKKAVIFVLVLFILWQAGRLSHRPVVVTEGVYIPLPSAPIPFDVWQTGAFLRAIIKNTGFQIRLKKHTCIEDYFLAIKENFLTECGYFLPCEEPIFSHVQYCKEDRLFYIQFCNDDRFILYDENKKPLYKGEKNKPFCSEELSFSLKPNAFPFNPSKLYRLQVVSLKNAQRELQNLLEGKQKQGKWIFHIKMRNYLLAEAILRKSVHTYERMLRSKQEKEHKKQNLLKKQYQKQMQKLIDKKADLLVFDDFSKRILAMKKKYALYSRKIRLYDHAIEQYAIHPGSISYPYQRYIQHIRKRMHSLNHFSSSCHFLPSLEGSLLTVKKAFLYAYRERKKQGRNIQELLMCKEAFLQKQAILSLPTTDIDLEEKIIRWQKYQRKMQEDIYLLTLEKEEIRKQQANLHKEILSHFDKILENAHQKLKQAQEKFIVTRDRLFTHYRKRLYYLQKHKQQYQNQIIRQKKEKKAAYEKIQTRLRDQYMQLIRQKRDHTRQIMEINRQMQYIGHKINQLESNNKQYSLETDTPLLITHNIASSYLFLTMIFIISCMVFMYFMGKLLFGKSNTYSV